VNTLVYKILQITRLSRGSQGHMTIGWRWFFTVYTKRFTSWLCVFYLVVTHL